ncbi:MAG: hypothetical protein E7591_01620 [Ruminococcaceae bacterium]|nr:hypothetical protein [Oscillospiraceae bacterium]
MKRILLLLISLLLCVTFCCCGGAKNGTELTDSSKDTEKGAESEEISKDTEADLKASDDPVTEPDDPSLNSFRQSMVGTTELFAVACIGYTDTMDGVDPILWMKEKVPNLCDDLPFMTTITEENIVGGDFGELYCIVPANQDVTITVRSIEFDGNDVEELYVGESGEPMLLFCNKGGYTPDVEVSVTAEDGSNAVWYPERDSSFHLADAYDLDGVDVMKDFTPYSELAEDEYEYYLNEAGFWTVPETQELTDTSWETTEYCEDGTVKVYYLDIFADTVNITWNDGIDEEFHSFTALWSLKDVDGITVMELNLGNLDGIRSYPLLITTEGNLIYFSQDFVNDDIRDYEKVSRVMERAYG